MKVLQQIIASAVGLAFIWIGIHHFINPSAFNAIVPDYLGWPYFWTYASGLFEVVFGVGIIHPRARKISACLLLVLVVLLSLANLNMWLNDIPFNGTRLSTRGHIVRWALQLILLFILAWIGGLTSRFSLKRGANV